MEKFIADYKNNERFLQINFEYRKIPETKLKLAITLTTLVQYDNLHEFKTELVKSLKKDPVFKYCIHVVVGLCEQSKAQNWHFHGVVYVHDFCKMQKKVFKDFVNGIGSNRITKIECLDNWLSYVSKNSSLAVLTDNVELSGSESDDSAVLSNLNCCRPRRRQHTDISIYVPDMD